MSRIASMMRRRVSPSAHVPFYKELARAYQELARAGVRPVPEIARRKRASENTVHQCFYGLRQLYR